MRDVLKKICAMAGVVASIEVMVVEGRQKRMDLVLHFSNPVRRVWVDVSVVNQQAEAYLDRDGVADRERAKISRWGRDARDAGVEFHPFVVYTFEKFGEGAIRILRLLAESAFLSSPFPAATSAQHWMGVFTRRCVERLAVALAHANCFIVDEAMVKAVDPKARSAQVYRGLRRLVC